jgi:hypothetical protein
VRVTCHHADTYTAPDTNAFKRHEIEYVLRLSPPPPGIGEIAIVDAHLVQQRLAPSMNAPVRVAVVLVVEFESCVWPQDVDGIMMIYPSKKTEAVSAIVAAHEVGVGSCVAVHTCT